MNSVASHLVCLVCALVSCLICPDAATASVRPHLSGGTAQFVSGTDFVGTGHATHLGRYSEEGSVVFSPTDDPAVLHVDGSIVYTAANGDELHAIVTGELNGLTGVISAMLSYVGGTGRFADASGSASLAGQSGPMGAISVSASGTIDF
jgi:hypothetical protein